MTYVKTITVSPSQARVLEHQGWVLKLISMHLDGTDSYKVYVREGEK